MRRLLFLIFVIALVGVGGWVLFHFGLLKRISHPAELVNITNNNPRDPLSEALELVKADRGEPAGPNAVVEVPPELKHYRDRQWFLATQVAEVGKHRLQTSQDFIDLAGMIERGEMVSVPAVTDTYVLLGVGQQANDGPFSRYQDNDSIEIYNAAQLTQAYKNLDDKRTALRSELAAFKDQARLLKKNEREKRRELQKEIGAREQQLNSITEDKSRLD
ncbi:MAG TPA: hypothetical protein VJS64_08525, partial [Pyrinomonadaceae bacterium]|nr:hypothetical protein [Pyrinomonadaceae bacterium]